MTEAPIHIVASDMGQIDPLAIDQLRQTARLPGIEKVVGLPDLHAGRGIAVGAAFWSSDHVFPHLVGSDIGCGMALYETDLALRKFKLEKSERKLVGLDDPWAGDAEQAVREAGLPDMLASPALGTIGGGNHFVEFQKIETVADADRFASIGIQSDHVLMLVHSGSRGLGQAILDMWLRRGGDSGIKADSDDGQAYLKEHDDAMRWAELNRTIIARRFCEKLGVASRRHLDICHNSVTAHDGGWLHRKGAAPADKGMVVIPGSRGDFSYLVEPVADHCDIALQSLAHGAGRKWSRKDAHARLSNRYRAAELVRTDLGGRVICEDKRLIFEEAPQAYKDIHQVIAALTDAGLIRVIATLRPLISYKMRRA